MHSLVGDIVLPLRRKGIFLEFLLIAAAALQTVRWQRNVREVLLPTLHWTDKNLSLSLIIIFSSSPSCTPKYLMRPAAEDAVAPPGVAATRNRGRRDRRYAVVTMALGATCVALACVAWAQGGGARTVAALQEMLCCDGCCAASAIPVSVTSAILEHDKGDERHGRSTILHLAGSAEIDYTAGGHRVSQHMQTALSELDHLEDHVKDGRPKFLTESAAQREADLESGSFSHQDLTGIQKAHSPQRQGESTRTRLVDPYAKAEAAQLAPAHQKSARATAASLTRKASRLAAARAPAATVETLTATRKAARKHEGASDETALGADEFQPINALKVGKMSSVTKAAYASERGSVNEGADGSTAEDVQDEQILRSLAQSDVSYHSRHGQPVQNAVHKERPQRSRTQAMVGPAQHTHDAQSRVLSTSPAHRSASIVKPIGLAQHAGKGGKGGQTGGKTGGKAGPGDEGRLRGVLSRIHKLINKQTNGASRHSSFLKHFEQDKAEATAKLAVLHKAAQARLAMAAARGQPQRVWSGAQLKSVGAAPSIAAHTEARVMQTAQLLQGHFHALDAKSAQALHDSSLLNIAL